MRKIVKIIFAITGLVPLLNLMSSPPDTTALIYSLFVLFYFLQPITEPLVKNIPLPVYVKFGLLMIAVGMVAEILAWSSSYLSKEEVPALFHPQLIPNLILGLGFYSGWALAWILILRRYRFSLTSVFIITGILGIAIEEDSQVLLAIIQSLTTNPLGSAVFAIYVFLIYGSVIGMAYMPIRNEIENSQQRNHWIKYPAILALMFIFAKITTLIVALVAMFFGLISDPQPIWESPLF